MERANKTAQVEDLKDRFSRMSSAVFLDFAGMNVAEVGALRDKFREKGVEYRVVKNTLVKIALKDSPFLDGLSVSLTRHDRCGLELRGAERRRSGGQRFPEG